MAAEKAVMVFGMDESEHSYYALEWTLKHLITPTTNNNPHFKLFVVHAKPSPAASMGFSGPAVVDVLATVERDLKRNAARVLDKAKQMCASKSVIDAKFEAVEGDARNVLCDAVERHQATMLVLGNHGGRSAVKRALLGSVSDYCVHHANCTVTVVKKPNTTKVVTQKN